MIVALHGNLGSTKDWDSLDLPKLHAVDLWQQSHLNFIEFAHELKVRTDPGSVLMGYSLGGRLALHAMAMYPEHWSRSVILSAHPGLCCVEDRLARRSSDQVWAKRARKMEWREFLEKWNEQPVLENETVSANQISLENRRLEIAAAFENWSLGMQEDLRSSLQKFTAPVLWVTGAKDQKFTRLGREMEEVFGDFCHEVIPDCGHRLLNHPELAALLRDFIP